VRVSGQYVHSACTFDTVAHTLALSIGGRGSANLGNRTPYFIRFSVSAGSHTHHPTHHRARDWGPISRLSGPPVLHRESNRSTHAQQTRQPDRRTDDGRGAGRQVGPTRRGQHQQARCRFHLAEVRTVAARHRQGPTKPRDRDARWAVDLAARAGRKAVGGPASE